MMEFTKKELLAKFAHPSTKKRLQILGWNKIEGTFVRNLVSLQDMDEKNIYYISAMDVDFQYHYTYVCREGDRYFTHLEKFINDDFEEKLAKLIISGLTPRAALEFMEL